MHSLLMIEDHHNPLKVHCFKVHHSGKVRYMQRIYYRGKGLTVPFIGKYLPSRVEDYTGYDHYLSNFLNANDTTRRKFAQEQITVTTTNDDVKVVRMFNPTHWRA